MLNIFWKTLLVRSIYKHDFNRWTLYSRIRNASDYLLRYSSYDDGIFYVHVRDFQLKYNKNTRIAVWFLSQSNGSYLHFTGPGESFFCVRFVQIRKCDQVRARKSINSHRCCDTHSWARDCFALHCESSHIQCQVQSLWVSTSATNLINAYSSISEVVFHWIPRPLIVNKPNCELNILMFLLKPAIQLYAALLRFNRQTLRNLKRSSNFNNYSLNRTYQLRENLVIMEVIIVTRVHCTIVLSYAKIERCCLLLPCLLPEIEERATFH